MWRLLLTMELTVRTDQIDTMGEEASDQWMQGRKAQTLAHGVTDCPVGPAAGIVEPVRACRAPAPRALGSRPSSRAGSWLHTGPGGRPSPAGPDEHARRGAGDQPPGGGRLRITHHADIHRGADRYARRG
jgi:hypothetical protein